MATVKCDVPWESKEKKMMACSAALDISLPESMLPFRMA